MFTQDFLVARKVIIIPKQFRGESARSRSGVSAGAGDGERIGSRTDSPSVLFRVGSQSGRVMLLKIGNGLLVRFLTERLVVIHI